MILFIEEHKILVTDLSDTKIPANVTLTHMYKTVNCANTAKHFCN